MKITNQVTRPEYQKLTVILSYRKAKGFFRLLVGLFLIAEGLFIIYRNRNNYYTSYMRLLAPYFLLALGVSYLLFMPLVIRRMAGRNYDTNRRLQEQLTWEFTATKLIVTGQSFTTERNWAETYKIEEIKDWFLIYENRAFANVIPKRDMSPAAVDELRSLLRGISIAGTKNLK